MLKIFLIASSLFLSHMALADGDHSHTETLCSSQNTAVCAHLGLHQELNSQDEGRFIAHIFTPNEALVSNLAVELWMPDMDHGSSPVALKDAGKNHYLVTNAWFIMKGAWLVKLSFDFEGARHQIDIPVEIVK